MTTKKRAKAVKAKVTEAWAAYTGDGRIYTSDSGPTVWRLREDARFDSMNDPDSFVRRVHITEAPSRRRTPLPTEQKVK